MSYNCFDDFRDLEREADRGRGVFLTWMIGIGIIFISVGIFLVNTRHGIGVWVDSTRYMGISERPFDAPLYAWMLQAVMPAFGVDRGAKLLGVIFVAVNSGLIWNLLVLTTRDYRFAVFGTALIVLSPQFVGLHAGAMSEPPFVMFTLITLLAFLRYRETDSRGWLVACAIALALATLTRFVAPPLGAALALTILMNPRQRRGRHIADAAILTVVSASVFLLWLFLSQLTAGRSIGREFWFYGNMEKKEWLTSLEALAAWLFPDAIPFYARVAILAAFIVSLAIFTIAHTRLIIRSAQPVRITGDILPATLGLFFLFYLAFIVLSTSLEANLSLNSRYAFPIYVTTMLMTTILLARLSRVPGAMKAMHVGVLALLLAVMVAHTVRTAIRSEVAYRMGVGYSSVAWRNSPTIAAVRALPANSRLYSNGADAIAYIVGRPASFIPERFQLRTGHENPQKPLALQLEAMRAESGQVTSHVVIFDKVDWRFYLLDEAQLVQTLSLEMIAEKADGRIYAMKGPNK